jgi:Metal-dependent hydrolases of the beta-lactamase superfamily III
VLGFHQIRRDYFAVLHSGEGDGWDPNRPAMASILVFQGKVYLIDAGPNIMHSLNALGISVNEIAGIFHTHGHDDHFCGLPDIMRADHRIPYYATPLVRASVMKKLAALSMMNGGGVRPLFRIPRPRHGPMERHRHPGSEVPFFHRIRWRPL